MNETKFILETTDEHDQFIPHLFIFKNGSSIMLNQKEIEEMRELTENMYQKHLELTN